MVKSKPNYLMFVVLAFICNFCQVQDVFALELKVSPFVLYEQGEENIYIDGVRTKYGLGAAGVAVEIVVGNNFSVGTRLGYGYHPKARVSLTVEGREVAVTGPVSGIYLEGGVDYHLWRKSNLNLKSGLRFISRNIDAPDLTGFAGSRAITGTAVNDFDTLDLTLDGKFRIGQNVFMNIAAGFSQWNLKTTAVAYSETGGSGAIRCPCSYTKKIDTVSVDPIIGAAISSDNPLHNFDLEVYSRSLKSKASTQIFGVELEYIFQF